MYISYKYIYICEKTRDVGDIFVVQRSVDFPLFEPYPI